MGQRSHPGDHRPGAAARTSQLVDAFVLLCRSQAQTNGSYSKSLFNVTNTRVLTQVK